MSDPNKGPQWQNPRKPIQPAPKPAPRDYVGPAIAALNGSRSDPSIVAAIIIAQALDRFGEKLIDAAAVSQYKRGP